MSGREGQTFGGRSVLSRYASLVKLPHTVFALPFAMVGVVFASYVNEVRWRHLLWVTVAFTAARFAAMAFNRVVDRRVDALNPRTAQREIPRGAIGVQPAIWSIVAAGGLFFLAAWQLNPLCFALAPVALAWVLGYSYTKRFTRLSHFVLGLGLAIAPVGGYLAVAGDWSQPWWTLVALAVAVMAWVGGFDILYALQDLEFDRVHRLYSIPAAIGPARAIGVARALHVLTVASLGAAGMALGAGWIYWVGVAVVAALLVYEHSLVSSTDLSRLDAAFFTMNGVISIVFLAFVVVERVAT